MRVKGEIDGKPFDVPMVSFRTERGAMSALAALQRETGWKMAEIERLHDLELVAMQMAIYMSLWKSGRKVPYARAELLIDDVEFIEEPGDAPEQEPEPGPTKAPAEPVGEGSDATP